MAVVLQKCNVPNFSYSEINLTTSVLKLSHVANIDCIAAHYSLCLVPFKKQVRDVGVEFVRELWKVLSGSEHIQQHAVFLHHSLLVCWYPEFFLEYAILWTVTLIKQEEAASLVHGHSWNICIGFIILRLSCSWRGIFTTCFCRSMLLESRWCSSKLLGSSAIVSSHPALGRRFGWKETTPPVACIVSLSGP